MNRHLKRRLERLEAKRLPGDDDLVAIEFSDEAKDILRATLTSICAMTPEEIEARVNRRYFERSAHVARLSAVEREQRLLAIRERVADHPAARAFLDAAIEEARQPSMTC